MSKNTKNPIETTNTSITPILDEEFPQTNEERLPFDGAAPVKQTLPQPRLLREDEIEVRVGQMNYDGSVTILLYKTARVDMDLMDETYGRDNWMRSHREVGGGIVCTVSVRDPQNPDHWISREDVGTESNTEATKGSYSDSFKRACVNWGIGRELYTGPVLKIPAANFRAYEKNGKKTTYDKFSVEAIRYDDDRNICAIAIRNESTGTMALVWYNDKAQMREG